MGLLTIFRSKAETHSASLDVEPAEAMKLRARRRLIGAVVLVAVGVVGLPLLFDRQPRPVSPDVAIEMAKKESVPVATPASAASVAEPLPPRVAAAPAEPSTDTVLGDGKSDANAPLVTPGSGSAAEPRVTAADAQTARATVKPAEKPTTTAQQDAKKHTPTASEEEAARALAALQDKPAAAHKTPAATSKAAEAGSRFVVQVGAFSGAESAGAARRRVEKLGLKTYTQVVDTAAGKRIRVRVGPYSERADAERAASRLKQAGMNPDVLTL